MSKKRVKSSGGTPRQPRRDKPGRIADTKLLIDPSDAVDDQAETLKAFAEHAIDVHFEQDLPFDIRHHLNKLYLSPSHVADIVHAAKIPLRGHTIVSETVVVSAEGQNWSIAPGKVTKVLAGDATVSTYKFDRFGTLIRTKVADFITPEDHEEISWVTIRDEGGPISREEILAAVAALLGAFIPWRLSLAHDAEAGVLDQLARIRHEALSLANNLHSDEARILRLVGSLGTEAICRQLVETTHVVERILKNAEAKQARIKLMGPLSACFRFLFGVPPEDAVAAFTRFGHAFFDVVGCPCKPATVTSNWRAWERQRHREVKSLPFARLSSLTPRSLRTLSRRNERPS